MSEDTQKNQANIEPATELTDDQLQGTSGGTGSHNVTLKRGLINSADIGDAYKGTDPEPAPPSETAELKQDD